MNGLVARGMVGGDAYEMRLALGFYALGPHGTPWEASGRDWDTSWDAMGSPWGMR